MNAQRWSQVMLVSLSLTALAMGPRARAQEAVGLAAKPASARPARPLLWSVPPERQIRLLIDSDAACESDDQAVIAHALLSSSFVVRGLVAAHFRGVGPSAGRSTAEAMQASYDEILTLLRVMRLEGCFPVRHGAAKPFADPAVPVDSEGADLIIKEAMTSGDPRPLFIMCQAHVTDLATAYVKEPRIADRLTAVWIGGAGYPAGGPEYNQDGDRIAANIVMESRIPLWQIPAPVYMLPRFSMTEIAEKVGQQGELGRFLYGRVVRFVSGFKWINEFFQYADEAAVGVLLQQPMWNGDFEMRPAPSIAPNGTYVHNGKNRPIRVYRSYDHRAGLEDLFAKLKAFAKGELRPSCGDKPTPQK